MFTPLLAHSNSSASGSVNFRYHKYAKATSAESHVQDDVAPTWGSSISGWIKGLVEETPATGDEIDQTRRFTIILAIPKIVDILFFVLLVAGPSTNAGIAEANKKTTPTTASRHDSKTTTPTRSADLSKWGQGMYQQLASAANERGCVFFKGPGTTTRLKRI
jgi:hypothetical protein